MNYCDSHPGIVEWSSEEHPVPYYFQGDSRWHRYFPDFWVKVRTKTGVVEEWLVEIKPEAQTKHPTQRKFANAKAQLKETLEYAKNQAKWDAAGKYCASRKFKFVILTEKDLYSRAP